MSIFFMKKTSTFYFIVISISCDKNNLIIEQSIDNYHLDKQYTNAYKSTYLQPLKLLRPDLLHFEDAVELNTTILGKGYLIPLSVNIQKINHSLEIKIFAFFL